MLFTIVVILLILWLLGVAVNVGSIIHLLLILILFVILVNLLRGRRAF